MSFIIFYYTVVSMLKHGDPGSYSYLLFIISLIQNFFMLILRSKNIQNQPAQEISVYLTLLGLSSPEYLAPTQACVNRHFAQAGGIFQGGEKFSGRNLEPTLPFYIYKAYSYPLGDVILQQKMIEFISHLSCCGSRCISWVRRFSGWKKLHKKIVK